MAFRSRPQLALRQQRTSARLVGAVGRASVGFGLAVGRSRAVHPVVRRSDLNSLALRPPTEFWRESIDNYHEAATPVADHSTATQLATATTPPAAKLATAPVSAGSNKVQRSSAPPEASVTSARHAAAVRSASTPARRSIASRRPTWTDQILRRSTIGWTDQQALGVNRPAPEAPPEDFVSTGDQRLDVMRLAMKKAAAASANAERAVASPPPGERPASSERRKVDESATAVSPDITSESTPTDTDRGSTSAGKRTAPGSLARSLQPERIDATEASVVAQSARTASPDTMRRAPATRSQPRDRLTELRNAIAARDAPPVSERARATTTAPSHGDLTDTSNRSNSSRDRGRSAHSTRSAPITGQPPAAPATSATAQRRAGVDATLARIQRSPSSERPKSPESSASPNTSSSYMPPAAAIDADPTGDGLGVAPASDIRSTRTGEPPSRSGPPSNPTSSIDTDPVAPPTAGIATDVRRRAQRMLSASDNTQVRRSVSDALAATGTQRVAASTLTRSTNVNSFPSSRDVPTTRNQARSQAQNAVRNTLRPTLPVSPAAIQASGGRAGDQVIRRVTLPRATSLHHRPPRLPPAPATPSMPIASHSTHTELSVSPVGVAVLERDTLSDAALRRSPATAIDNIASATRESAVPQRGAQTRQAVQPASTQTAHTTATPTVVIPHAAPSPQGSAPISTPATSAGAPVRDAIRHTIARRSSLQSTAPSIGSSPERSTGATTAQRGASPHRAVSSNSLLGALRSTVQGRAAPSVPAIASRDASPASTARSTPTTDSLTDTRERNPQTVALRDGANPAIQRSSDAPQPSSRSTSAASARITEPSPPQPNSAPSQQASPSVQPTNTSIRMSRDGHTPGPTSSPSRPAGDSTAEASLKAEASDVGSIRRRITASTTTGSGDPRSTSVAPAATSAHQVVAPTPPAPSAPPRTSAELVTRFMTELSATVQRRPDVLPSSYRPMADAITGGRRVLLSTDSSSRRALQAVGKVAATTNDTIHIDPTAAPRRRIDEVMAHELTHVAHPSATPRFFDDIDHSPEERKAEQVAAIIARSPLAPNAPASSRAPDSSQAPSRPPVSSPNGSSPMIRRTTDTSSTAATGTHAALQAKLASSSGSTSSSSAAGANPSALAASIANSTDRAVQRRVQPAAPSYTVPRTSTGQTGITFSDLDDNDDAETWFIKQIDRNFDHIVHQLEQRMLLDFERRGGRIWGEL
ncbi:MAG: hypothetical protein ACI8V4_001918 [Ilumatobacter sp.]|jgi:hypothetical protein